jgi:putative hydrolase of the HAD superfamily
MIPLHEATHLALDMDGTMYDDLPYVIPRLVEKTAAYFRTHVPALKDADPNTVFHDLRRRHGSFWLGLEAEHGVDIAHCIEKVHDFDLSPVPPAPRTAELLSQITIQKCTFTESPRFNAHRTMKQLGVLPHIDGTFAIEDAGHYSKLKRETFELYFSTFDVDPLKAVMFDNNPACLVWAKHFGMTTGLIHGDKPAPRAPHIDYAIPTLDMALEAVIHGPFVHYGNIRNPLESHPNSDPRNKVLKPWGILR